jgi:hypothetical protein
MGAFEWASLPITVTSTSGTKVGSYFFLKNAFDAINAGTHTGEITVKINGNTDETASATLYQSLNGSSNYSSVNIYPTVTGLSITGNLAAPLIDLNKASSVTFDGRVNATGTTPDLTITNKNISSTAGTSTIRLINDASYNFIKYCNLKGSSQSITDGIVCFSTASSTGNNTNTIIANNITKADAILGPINAVYSIGTTSILNRNNTISNNKIYDHFNTSATSYAIQLSTYNTSWNISGNNFYQTTSLAPSSSNASYIAISIAASGTGFSVNNNFIGGSAPSCSGTWNKINSSNNYFSGIIINAGTDASSEVQGNTIKSFSWANDGGADWTAIDLRGGEVNIGTVTGNTIGSTTGTGSITVTAGSTNARVIGLSVLSGTVDFKNNNIGSLTADNSCSTCATHLYPILLPGGNVSIINNLIGSTTTSNSINSIGNSTVDPQWVQGIYSSSEGVVTISGNTIANLKNGTTNTNASIKGDVQGIVATAGTHTITNNTIHDLTIANASTATEYTIPAAGIVLRNASPKVQNISGNEIYNLSNSYGSFAGSVAGIYYMGSTTGGTL